MLKRTNDSLSVTTDRREEKLLKLEEAIADLVPYLAEETVSASLMINPLLLVWDGAHDLGPAVARPVETMLTALVHRSTVSTGEVLSLMDETRALAVQAFVLPVPA